MTEDYNNWLVYTDGVLTSVYSGDWTPVGKQNWFGQLWDDFVHKKELSFGVNVTEKSSPNLRTCAGGSFDIIGKLARGAILNQARKVDNGWMEVTTEDDQKGWVDSQYTEAEY